MLYYSMINHWIEHTYLHLISILKYKVAGCASIKMTACQFLCVLHTVRKFLEWILSFGMVSLMEMACWLAEIWAKDAEINLILLYLSLELPVSTHPSRKRRSLPSGSCKFFGGLCKIKKRASIVISASYSILTDFFSDVNEKSTRIVLSWTLLPSRDSFVLSESKIRSEHPYHFVLQAGRAYECPGMET